jgi:hypothetical protein
MLYELKDKLGSITKSLDIIYVIEGTKQVSRILLDSKQMDFLDTLKDIGLKYELSDFKILKEIDSKRNYSDIGLRISKDSTREGLYLLYISREHDLAKKAKALEENNDHYALGALLGYPTCCCNFFERHCSDALKLGNDFTAFTFRESDGFHFPWLNNNCLRGFDISLISHFPCKFDCCKTKEIASRNLEIIKKYDSDLFNYFSRALKSGVLYSMGVGVFSFSRMRVENNIVTYSPREIVSSAKNDMHNIILHRDTLAILGKNKFLIGEIPIEDSQTFFAIFS